MLQELMPIYSKDGTCQTIKEYVERHDNTEIDGIKQDIEDLKVDKVDKVENAVEGDVAGLTASGNIFDTGISLYGEKTYDYAEVLNIKNALPVPAVDCKVKVKPIQDLHGYDAPWVGGAGKNKFIGGNGGSQGGVTIIKNSDGSYSFNGTATETVVFTIAGEYYLPNESYILSGGTPDIHIGFTYGSERADDAGAGVSFSISDEKISWVQFVIPTGVNTTGKTIYPMVRLATETDPTFAPYSNECPISGTNEVEISVSDGESEPTTTTIPLPSTLYGGTVDVTEGSGDSRYGYIASYNGETLPGAWISDRDVYTGSNSPTIGAEVAYELATPTTLSLTPTDVELLEGTNVVSANTGDISMTVKYDRLADLEDRVTALENA